MQTPSDICMTNFPAHKQNLQQVTLDSSVEEVVNHRVDFLGEKEDEDIISLGQGGLEEEFVEQVDKHAPMGMSWKSYQETLGLSHFRISAL